MAGIAKIKVSSTMASRSILEATSRALRTGACTPAALIHSRRQASMALVNSRRLHGKV